MLRAQTLIQLSLASNPLLFNAFRSGVENSAVSAWSAASDASDGPRLKALPSSRISRALKMTTTENIGRPWLLNRLGPFDLWVGRLVRSRRVAARIPRWRYMS